MIKSFLPHAVLTLFLLAVLNACGGSGSSSSDKENEGNTSAKARAKAYTGAVNQLNEQAERVAAAHDDLFGPQPPLTATALEAAHDRWLDVTDDYADALEGLIMAANTYQTKAANKSNQLTQGKAVSDELLSLVPGTDSGVGLSAVKEMRDSVQAARNIRAQLDKDYQNGLIDEQEYRAAIFRESQAQAGRLAVVGGATVGGAFVSTVGGLAAGAAGVSLLPAIAVGTVTGYVGGKVFNYFFTSSQDDSDNCASGCTVAVGQSDDGTVRLPAGETGTLTIAQENTQPVAIRNINLDPETPDSLIHVEPQPDDEPFESQEVTVETQERSSTPPLCADIMGLKADFRNDDSLPQAHLTVTSTPLVDDCEILVSGQVEASAPFGRMPIQQTIKTGEDASFSVPEFGDYLLSVRLEVISNGLDMRLSRSITQPDVGISLIERVSPSFSVAIGERLDLDHLYVRIFFTDGTQRVVSAASDSHLTWQMQNNKGNLDDNFFTATSSGLAEFLVSYNDDNKVVGSTPYTVIVEAEANQNDEVIVGVVSTLFTSGSMDEKSHCVSYSEYPLSWSADDISTFKQSCSDLSGCDRVEVCPSDWSNACEQLSGGNSGGAVTNTYYYKPDPIGSSEFACNRDGGTWRTNL